MDQRIDGAPTTIDPRSFIQLDVIRQANFEQLFHRFFDEVTDRGLRKQLFFPNAPNDLLIQVGRVYRDANGLEAKHSGLVHAPERMALPGQFVRSGQGSQYECDAFLVHQGSLASSGHYVAYIKVAGVWWCCSDTNVQEVSSSQAQSALGESYILHYAKS